MRILLLLLLAFAVPAAAADRDVTAEYASRDFAPLLMPKTVFLGFIGNDYQRLRIHFTAITKDPKNPRVYRVKGWSLVKNNRCDFEGVLNVQKITAIENMHYGVDEMYKDAGLKAQGVFSAAYDFRENPAEKHAGVFRGTMALDWYVDARNKLLYDKIGSYSDDYENNQYTGTWTLYGAGTKSKTANWGEYRIPNSGDLDIGAGEFGPNPKYNDKGWADYQFGQ